MKCVPFSGKSYKYFSQTRKKGTHCVPFLENHFSDLNTKNKTYRDRLLFQNHGRNQFRSATKCVPFSKFRLKTFRRFSPLSATYTQMPTAKKQPLHTRFDRGYRAVRCGTICYALRSVFKISHINFSPIFRHPARRTLSYKSTINP